MVTGYSKSQVPLFLYGGKLTEYQLKNHDCSGGFSLSPLCPGAASHCPCLGGEAWEAESQVQRRCFPEHPENTDNRLSPGSESPQNGSLPLQVHP